MGSGQSQSKTGEYKKHGQSHQKVSVTDRKSKSEVYTSEHTDQKSEDNRVSYIRPQNDISFKKAIYSGIYNVRMYGVDTQTCRIRGAEFLLNGNLIMCDQANFKLKLWSSVFQYLYYCDLPGRPHDLCIHSSDRGGSYVFVTIPSERTIMEFYIEDKIIIPGKEIRTDGWCYGIATYKTGLVVCVGTKIELLDTDGNILKSLQYDKNGNTKFGSPFHVSVTPENNIVVVDSFKHCVTCINENGDEIFKYTDMNVPHSMFVDKDGYTFLCGSDSRVEDVLHQITKKGIKAKSILSWRHVGFKPDTVCYRSWDQLLAVFGENDRMKTFKLVTRKTGRLYSNDVIMEEEMIEDNMLSHRSTQEVKATMKRILQT